MFKQWMLTFGRRITVQLVSSFTSLDSDASIHTQNNIFSMLVKLGRVKPEPRWTVIFPRTVSVLRSVWPEKNRQMSIKLAQKWFYKKIIDFDTFSKIP